MLWHDSAGDSGRYIIASHPTLYPVEFAALIRYDVPMVKLNEKYVTDRAGQPTDVVLSRKDYQKLLDYLEDLEDRLEIRKRKRGAKFVAWESAKARLTAPAASL